MKSYVVVAIVLVLAQVLLVHSSPCPIGAKRFGNKCYRLESRRKQWLDANNACKLSRGHLATIDSLGVNNFLYVTYRKSGGNYNMWFGVKKCNNDWCYHDRKARIGYTNWNAGEPNNRGGREDCVEMWRNGKWNDAPCTELRPYICEIPGDECALGTHKCHPQATCRNTFGSYTCTCNAGFVGNGTLCTVGDECALGTHKCHPQATCRNTFRSYTCTCNAGFVGNGMLCTEPHKKILQVLQDHGKELTKIELMLQKLLGTSGTSKKTSANGGI